MSAFKSKARARRRWRQGSGAALSFVFAWAGALAAVSASPVTGQVDAASSETTEVFEPTDLGDGPYHEMSALMEVTVFDIDVLMLTVRVGPETATRLGELVAGREYSEELADSVAAVMLDAEHAWARQVFKRDVGLGRLADGMRETTDKAAEAGFISQEYAEEFASNVPVWFAFLEEEGAREGDAIYFRLRGDEVRTIYRSVDGRVLMDEVGESAEGRRASIPSFFAPDTRFRKRLVESLLDD